MTDQTTCVECDKSSTEHKLFPVPGGAWVCEDCAMKYFLRLAAMLRHQGRDVAVVGFTYGTADEIFFNVFDDDGRAREIVGGRRFPYNCNSVRKAAECFWQIINGIREVLRPHELKTVEGEIAEAKRKLAELEKKRDLIESKTQFDKA